MDKSGDFKRTYRVAVTDVLSGKTGEKTFPVVGKHKMEESFTGEKGIEYAVEFADSGASDGRVISLKMDRYSDTMTLYDSFTYDEVKLKRQYFSK